jgi:hypothetical protein
MYNSPVANALKVLCCFEYCLSQKSCFFSLAYTYITILMVPFVLLYASGINLVHAR